MEKRKYGGLTLAEWDKRAIRGGMVSDFIDHIRELTEELAQERADKAIKLANAAGGAEPVAWFEYTPDQSARFLAYSYNPDAKTIPLYTAPPATYTRADVMWVAEAVKTAVLDSEDEYVTHEALAAIVDQCLGEPAPAVLAPDGWQLVPKMPTAEMVSAYENAACGPLAMPGWRAILSAAPKHGEGEA